VGRKKHNNKHFASSRDTLCSVQYRARRDQGEFESKQPVIPHNPVRRQDWKDGRQQSSSVPKATFPETIASASRVTLFGIVLFELLCVSSGYETPLQISALSLLGSAKRDKKITSFGPIVFAEAQSTPMQAQYPLEEIATVNVTGKLAAVVEKKAILVGAGDYCYNVASLNSDFSSTVAQYAKTTITVNNCVDLTVNKNGTLIFVADQAGSGALRIFNATTNSLIGSLSGVTKPQSVALSNDEKIAYVMYQGSTTPYNRIMRIDVSNPVSPTLPDPTPIDVPYSGGMPGPAGYEYAYQVRSKNNRLVARFHAKKITADPLGDSDVSGWCLFDTTNSSVPVKINCQTWNRCTAALRIDAITIGFSEDGTQVTFTASSPASYVPSCPPTGLMTRDSSNFQPMRSASFAYGGSSLILMNDNKLGLLATKDGISVYSFDQLIPTDPPAIISTWKMPGGVKSLQLSPDGRFVYAQTNADQLKILLMDDLLNVSVDTVVAHPVFLNQNDNAELMAGQNNAGKLVFFANPAASTGPQQIKTTVSSVQLVDGATLSDASGWVTLNADNSFLIHPPKNKIGQTITLRFTSVNGTSDVDFHVVPDPQSVETHTASKSVIPATTAQPLTQPVATSQPSTQQPATAQPATARPAITMVATTANPTSAPAQTFPQNVNTLAPGATIAPDAIKIMTASSGKVQIQSTADESTVIIFMRPGVDTPMRASFPAVKFFFDNAKGELRLIGKPDDINFALSGGRISSVDNAGDSQIELTMGAVDQALYQGYDVTAIQKITLGQFGGNHAPDIIFNNATNVTQVNATLGASFSFSVKPFFTDIDGDPLTYYLVDGPEWLSLRNGIISGIPLAEGEFEIAVASSDGAKNSKSFLFSVNSQYQRPTIDEAAIQRELSVKAGTQKTIKPIPRSAVTGTGTLRCTVSLENGDALPEGIEWDADLWELTVRGKALVDYPLKFTVKDIYDAETHVVIPLHLVDNAPVANQTAVPDIVAVAEKSKEIAISSDVLTDSDGDLLSFTLTPQYTWAQFTKTDSGKLLLSLIPPKSALGQCIAFMLNGFDGYLSASVNITVCVPPNRPPQIATVLQNKTYTTGNSATYSVFDAFYSPDNHTLEYEVVGVKEGREVRLEDFLEFDKRREEITINDPKSDHVGSYLLRVRVKDPLGDEASQTIQFDIEFSTLDALWYWLLRVGVPLTTAGGLAWSAWELYEKFYHVRNVFRGKRYVKENVHELFEYNLQTQQYEYRVKDEHFFSFEFYKQAAPAHLHHKLFTCVSKPFSYYANNYFKLFEHQSRWIEADSDTCAVFIDPQKISDESVPIVMHVLDKDKRILEEVTIDPKEFAERFLVDRQSIAPLLLPSPPPKTAVYRWKKETSPEEKTKVDLSSGSSAEYVASTPSDRSEESGDLTDHDSSAVLVVPPVTPEETGKRHKNPLRSSGLFSPAKLDEYGNLERPAQPATVYIFDPKAHSKR